MPDRWMTLAAAAALLSVHPRTIERRMASGKIQSRRTDDGQLQVLLTNAPDESVTPPPVHDPIETVKELAHDQITLATGSASALVRLAQHDAERARDELELVRQETTRARRGAKAAWITVGLMSASICAAVGWTTYQITRNRGEISSLHQRAADIERESTKLIVERDLAQRDAQNARLKEAEAEGRLAAYVEHSKFVSDKRPTTRPASVIQRIASAIAND